MRTDYDRPVCFIQNVLGWPGGICGETEPDPISNSAVKLSCADGTKPQGLEELVAARPAKDVLLLLDTMKDFKTAAILAAVSFVGLPLANEKAAARNRSGFLFGSPLLSLGLFR